MTVKKVTEHKRNVLTTAYGKYIWWPALGIVDYVVKGTRSHVQIACCSYNKNTMLDATNHALAHQMKHIQAQLKVQRNADKRLAEENAGITDSWVE